jgi:hypothetical protein
MCKKERGNLLIIEHLADNLKKEKPQPRLGLSARDFSPPFRKGRRGGISAAILNGIFMKRTAQPFRKVLAPRRSPSQGIDNNFVVC